MRLPTSALCLYMYFILNSLQEKIKEDGWGGREQHDIRMGIESLMEAGIAKPGKVGITGMYSCVW